MLHDIFFLVLGLVLLVIGANYVTDGAVAVAKRFHVSNLIIGLTVVALGSSLPDIVVCVESAFQHKPTIAVGSVIGANVFDLLLVVGIMGIIRPWSISKVMRTQDLPILVIASMALWIAGDTVLFDGAHHNVIDRSSGIMLILIFVFYMWFMLLTSKPVPASSSLATSDNSAASTQSATSDASNVGIAVSHSLARKDLNEVKADLNTIKGKRWFSWLQIVVGLGALVLGGNWVVDGASGLALKVGMSQAMVALTVVAIGNSLPDLVTSLTATLKGASGIAFGNIVGSCIINALLTTGLSALIIPLDADSIGFIDFFSLVGASLLLWIVPMLTPGRRVNRLFGICLTLLYIGYMAFTVVRG